MEQNSEIIIYTDSDGTTKLQVQLEDETVWLTQDQMAMLFGKAKSTINEHIKNIYAENELEESQTLKKFGISEFQQKAPHYYNLDVIISVGYRVKSIQGTKFRQWVTKRIHEYIVKGFRDLEITKIPVIMSSYAQIGGIDYEDNDITKKQRISTDC